VVVHQGNQNAIVAHQGTQGVRDVLTNATAVIGGRRKQNKNFQDAQAVTNSVRVAHPHANMTAVGRALRGTLMQDIKGSNTQITFKRATNFHDVLFKPTKASQLDYRKKEDVIPCCLISRVEETR
jgi:hypothetical protein